MMVIKQKAITSFPETCWLLYICKFNEALLCTDISLTVKVVKFHNAHKIGLNATTFVLEQTKTFVWQDSKQ